MHNRNRRNRSFNSHHMMWERKQYQGKDKALRQLGGLIVPATLYTHQLLHAQMRPPVKPFAKLRNDIMDYGRTLPLNKGRFHAPERIADWLEGQSEVHTSDEYAFRSYRLAQHLRQQMGYLALEDI